jgi:DNA-binding NtrC family response regulator
MTERCDVFVVDDEPVVLGAVRRVLESEGMRVESAPSAEAALVNPALRTCRLVLCDLMLPRRSGLELLEEARRRRPELPVVMMTGYGTAENEARALQAGALGFLRKPFDPTELMEEVCSALAAARADREERRS